MFFQDPLSNYLELLILGQLNLRFGIQVDHKQFRPVVFKHNRPKLLVIDLDTEPQIEMTEDEKIRFVADRILREHKAAFEELAK